MSHPSKSPLAPAAFPEMPDVSGVTFAARRTESLRHLRGLLLAEFAAGTTVAGVFTQSKMPAAPVLWCRDALEKSKGQARALIVNAGNANAFTGKAGESSVEKIARAGADLLECPPHEVYVCSTGVIGEPLNPAEVTAELPQLHAQADTRQWREAAEALRTTDTFPKAAWARARIDGVEATIGGVAKGSGMIAPDMATLLAFLFTDAALAPDVLQAVLARAVERSFNCITVDGDTSTSDTVLAFATGHAASDGPVRDIRDPRLRDFRAKMEAVCRELAHQIVKDGEGARKFLTVSVTGATSRTAARRAGLSIANSPLVKTAIAGEDANWGRIVMAVGKSGEKADRDNLQIRIGDQLVTQNGMRHPDYDEGRAAQHLKGDHIEISVDLGVGRGRATVWSCDFTEGYIRINADYRS